jgi:hypothetical protein
MRLAPISLTGSALDFSASDDYTTSGGGTSGYTGIAPGTIVEAAPTTGVDTTANVPNWGVCEVMYVLNTSANTFIPGTLVNIDKDFAISTVPNTGLVGRPCYVVLTNFAAGNTTAQGGWVLTRGVAPVKYSVAATAGPVYISATAGQATPTNPTGGKQIIGATCLIAASGSFTRAVQTQTASSRVKVSNTAGVYTGMAISGTGIPASSVISSVESDGMTVVIGSAIGTPVNATATGAVTGTFTHTGYGICHINLPQVQGSIT